MPMPDRKRAPMISPAAATAMATVTPARAPLSKALSRRTGPRAERLRTKHTRKVVPTAISAAISSLKPVVEVADEGDDRQQEVAVGLAASRPAAASPRAGPCGARAAWPRSAR